MFKIEFGYNKDTTYRFIFMLLLLVVSVSAMMSFKRKIAFFVLNNIVIAILLLELVKYTNMT